MTQLWPVPYALFLWWFTTGVIFYLDSRPAHTFKWSMVGATALFAVVIYGIARTSGDGSLTGIYAAFTCGLLAWGWQEISLYLGYVTGPRKQRCPEGCKGIAHFGHAIAVNLWHEIAIILTAALIAWISWGAVNELGMWTFLVLWWMHLSARLNVFLGVRNVSAEFVPPHMEVLKGFLRKRPMNLLFPFSVTATTICSVFMVLSAIDAATPAEQVGHTLLATLMVLATLEHWFLVLPLPVERLWSWSLASKGRSSGQGGGSGKAAIFPRDAKIVTITAAVRPAKRFNSLENMKAG